MDALRCPPAETKTGVLSGGERRRVAPYSLRCAGLTRMCFTLRPEVVQLCSGAFEQNLRTSTSPSRAREGRTR